MEALTIMDVAKKPYHHGHVAEAMRAAARAMIDQDGPEGVGLREAARRIGVSTTASYRYYQSKDDLLASVAADGFRELSAALDVAIRGPDSILGTAIAYVEFALKNRGLFRLMFGPILLERAKYPKLSEAAEVTFNNLHWAAGRGSEPRNKNVEAMAAWSLLHGLSFLIIEGLVPEENARALAEAILSASGRALATRPELPDEPNPA
jgi:AcrR family transcriptional regulator